MTTSQNRIDLENTSMIFDNQERSVISTDENEGNQNIKHYSFSTNREIIGVTNDSLSFTRGFSIEIYKSDDQIEEQIEEQIEDNNLNQINGNVLNINHDSVLCEMLSKENIIELQLPLALFPEEPDFGASFTLYIDESTGFRRPVIEFRESDSEFVADALVEADDILSKFN